MRGDPLRRRFAPLPSFSARIADLSHCQFANYKLREKVKSGERRESMGKMTAPLLPISSMSR